MSTLSEIAANHALNIRIREAESAKREELRVQAYQPLEASLLLAVECVQLHTIAGINDNAVSQSNCQPA